MSQIDARIRQKRDTAANWTNNNPVLLNGELIVVETSAGAIRFKIGDGIKTFNQLPYTDESIYNTVDSKIAAELSGYIPEGGTARQLLGKTESGTEWVDPPQSGVQPDWNQNDSTAANYVKNKPFNLPTRCFMTLWMLCQCSNWTNRIIAISLFYNSYN